MLVPKNSIAFSVYFPSSVKMCDKLNELEKQGKLMQYVKSIETVLNSRSYDNTEVIDKINSDKLWRQLVLVSTVFANKCIMKKKCRLALGEKTVRAQGRL